MKELTCGLSSSSVKNSISPTLSFAPAESSVLIKRSIAPEASAISKLRTGVSLSEPIKLIPTFPSAAMWILSPLFVLITKG